MTAEAATPARSKTAWVRAALVLLPCVYGPYAWVITSGSGWSDYRWQWVLSWPVLPGLLPGHFALRDYSSGVEYLGMAAITAVMLVVVLWIGSRGRWWLAGTAAVTLGLSVLNSVGAYHAFRM